jgi:hypothetical protein
MSPARFAGQRISTMSAKTGSDIGITITDGLSAKIKLQHNTTVAIIINAITTIIILNMFVVFPVILNATFIFCGAETFGIDTPTITFNTLTLSEEKPQPSATLTQTSPTALTPASTVLLTPSEDPPPYTEEVS